jgi:hypothetical protein
MIHLREDDVNEGFDELIESPKLLNKKSHISI